MTEDAVLGAVAVGAPVTHGLLMGTIGYPMATRSRQAMARFHRSGFTWWLLTLAVVVCAGLVLAPEALDAGAPTGSVPSLGVALALFCVGLLGCLAVEIAGAALSRWRRTESAARGAQRYTGALPLWAATPRVELILLVVTAGLEEAVYRGVALHWFLDDLGAQSWVAVVVVAVAFGAAHWYFGVRQMVLKSALGLVLGIVAVLGAWWVAALAHAALNCALLLITRLNQRAR